MIRIADMTNVWENVISHLEGLGYDRELQILPNLRDYIDERCAGLLVVSEAEFEEEYDQGKADGFYEGKAEGFNAGYEEGFEKGLEIGGERGSAEDFDKGAKKGFAEGYQLGYGMGHDEGFNKGFDYGVCK